MCDANSGNGGVIELSISLRMVDLTIISYSLSNHFHTSLIYALSDTHRTFIQHQRYFCNFFRFVSWAVGQLPAAQRSAVHCIPENKDNKYKDGNVANFSENFLDANILFPRPM